MSEITRSTSREVGVEPNDWVEYVKWDDPSCVLHVDEFFNPKLNELQPGFKRVPPSGWTNV